VQGHTDSVGSDAYNEQLSERRASSVERYLTQRGVDGRRIAAEGYGEGYPVASNQTQSGRQLNRRVDILLKAKA
ncbi:MAG: OmpA family protein, partial [Thermoanaerobaculia bacterium]